jgi:uncharacterized protein
MSPDPAEQLDVAALAGLGSQLEFECPLDRLKRLAPLLRDTRGSVRGRLRFHREAGWPAADGQVAATLKLTCQRCLGEVSLPVDSQCRLAFVEGEAVDEAAPTGYELASMHGGRTTFAELAEDELILALPLVALHGEGARCRPRQAPEAKPGHEQTQRPFAGLRELMKDRT